MADPVYIVTSPKGSEIARFDESNTPPDRDGDVIPMRHATLVACEAPGRQVYRFDGDERVLLLTSVSASMHQPIDLYGSGRGKGAA